MSLGDELRILRAKAGGLTPETIAASTGVDAGLYCQLEQRYREMGDDDTVEKLASFFGCSVQMLKNARSRSRKALSQHLDAALRNRETIGVHLRNGETLSGLVAWWDLGAFGLQEPNTGTLIVVQRHAVIDW